MTDSCTRTRKEVHVDIGTATPPYYPLSTMLTFLAASCHHSLADPLFVLSSSKLLTRVAITDTVRCMLTAAKVLRVEMYSGHSFRIGAADTVAAAGWCTRLDNSQGGPVEEYSSRCYKHLPMDMKQHPVKQLASVQRVGLVWSMNRKWLLSS